MLEQKSPVAQDKPFACDVKGCEMTFTNKDHLDWHRKKHEMMLNLGLVNKNSANEVADQTPTPTRFIRNCEEVGLFQDLQNENPFDEIFKKAVDLAKSGATLEVQEASADDTLHTPHILPHITEQQMKEPTLSSKNDSDCEAFIFPSANNDNSDSESTIIVIDDAETDLKKKIKETIQNRINRDVNKNNHSENIILRFPDKSINQQLICNKGNSPTSPVITVIPLQTMIHNKNAIKENKCVDNKMEKIREMNRAAQNRCRKRKQQLWKEMEEELLYLRQENKILKQELETIRLQHSKCKVVSHQGAMMTSIVAPEAIVTTEASQALPTTKITSPTPAPGVPVPLLIQIIPNTQLSVVPSDSTTQPNTSSALVTDITSKQIKKRPFRKIIPKIIIKKKS